jgi:hypothetical protein
VDWLGKNIYIKYLIDKINFQVKRQRIGLRRSGSRPVRFFEILNTKYIFT